MHLFASEVLIIFYHSLPNAIEHMLSHPKPTAEMPGTKQWFWHPKVIIIQKDMASLSVAIQSGFMS